MEKEVTCAGCRRRLILGFHLVERFHREDDVILVFHRDPCFKLYMARKEYRRQAIFEKDQENLKSRAQSRSIYQRLYG